MHQEHQIKELRAKSFLAGWVQERTVWKHEIWVEFWECGAKCLSSVLELYCSTLLPLLDPYLLAGSASLNFLLTHWHSALDLQAPKRLMNGRLIEWHHQWQVMQALVMCKSNQDEHLEWGMVSLKATHDSSKHCDCTTLACLCYERDLHSPSLIPFSIKLLQLLTDLQSIWKGIGHLYM